MRTAVAIAIVISELFAGSTLAEPAPTPPPRASGAQVAAAFKGAAPQEVLRRIEAACRQGGLKVERDGDASLICSTSHLIDTTDGSLRAGRGVVSGPDGEDNFTFTVQANGSDTTVFEAFTRRLTARIDQVNDVRPREAAHREAMVTRVKAFLGSLSGVILDLKPPPAATNQPELAALFKATQPDAAAQKIWAACQQRNFSTRRLDPVTISCATTRLVVAKDGALQARRGNDPLPAQEYNFVFFARALGGDTIVFERSSVIMDVRLGAPLPKIDEQQRAERARLNDSLTEFLTTLGGQMTPLDAPITKP